MKELEKVLQKHWGYERFRPLQKEIIEGVLQKRNVLALMPTGGGKSICFQVPALLQPGITLVISPLTALIQDQVQQLKARKISAEALYAGMGKKEMNNILDRAVNGDLKLLYLSPERLQTKQFKERIPYMNISLLVIDEAHCISQWGHDFRPSYLQIPTFKEKLLSIPTIAVTATATSEVQADIRKYLGLLNPLVFKKSFLRPNLSYVVRKPGNKEQALLSILNKVPGSAIVYTDRRAKTEKIADWLQRHRISATCYHAGLDSKERKLRQEAWIREAKRVMVATNAFGMGIDKGNVRLVVHMVPPLTLEAYYQEAGRAGRDEQQAYAVLFYHQIDLEDNLKQVASSYLSVDEVKAIYQTLANYYKIAVGSHEGISYPIAIEEVAATYDLNPKVLRAGIKQLELAGLVKLDDQYAIPAKLHIQLRGQQLYAFQVANPALGHLVKTVINCYGPSLFYHFGVISLNRLAQGLKLERNILECQLKELDQLGVVSYSPSSRQGQLTFLTPRYAVDMLPISHKAIIGRKAIDMGKAKAVNSYVQHNYRCRTQCLTEYLGEVSYIPCKTCDICLAKRKKNLSERKKHQAYASQIVNLLKKQRMPVHLLIEKLDSEDVTMIGNVIQGMLEAGKLAYDAELQLFLKE